MKKLLAIVISFVMFWEIPIVYAESGVDGDNISEIQQVQAERGEQTSIQPVNDFYYLSRQERLQNTTEKEIEQESELAEDVSNIIVNEPFYLTIGRKDESNLFIGYEEELQLVGEGLSIKPVAETEFAGQVFQITPSRAGQLQIAAYQISNEKALIAAKEITVLPADDGSSPADDLTEAEQSKKDEQGVAEQVLQETEKLQEKQIQETENIQEAIHQAEEQKEKQSRAGAQNIAPEQAELTISNTEQQLYIGDTVQLTVQVQPAQEVIWSTSSSMIASVSATGLVTARSEGIAFIKVRAGYVSRTCTITVSKHKLSLSKTILTLYKGQSAVLKASAVPTAAAVFRSSNSKIAAVDHTGRIKALQSGTAVITATAHGLTVSCRVTVKNPVLTIRKAAATIYLRYPVSLGAKTVPTARITYKSSNTKIAVVDSKGRITGKKTGRAVITATANGIRKSCQITVKKPSLSLTEINLMVFEKNTYQLTAKPRPTGALKWKSSNAKIVSVDKAGILTGRRAGKAKVSVSFNGITKVCNITVLKNKYKLNKSSQILMQGATTKLYMNALNSNGTGYVYYSIEQSTESGVVALTEKNNICTIKALKPGRVTINATYYYSHEGMWVACTNKAVIRVTNKGIAQQQPAIAVKTKKQLSLKGVNQPNNAIQRIEWKSSNTKVASINRNGLVTGRTRGVTKITAKLYYADQTTKEYSTSFKVSNPAIAKNKKVITIDSEFKFPLTGLTTYSNVVYKSSKKSIATVMPDGRIVANGKKGTVIITATADGKRISLGLYVTNPKLKESFKPLAVGATHRIRLTGTIGKSKITYKSKNTSIAAVSKAGLVKAKRRGTAMIEVIADGKKMQFEVNVASAKAIQAVNQAKQIMYSSTYSQPYRMSAGYYDCSSLTYRGYQPNASALLGGGSWAPTAAAQAQHMAATGKVIAFGPVEVSKLQPGDLLFFGGSYNGRYKNIYHVSMYYGGGLRIEKPMRVYYPLDNIVMVARPTM